MQDGAPLLHAAVVAAADDGVVQHQDRADGDAALGQALAGLLDGGGVERVHHESPVGLRAGRERLGSV